MAPLKPFEELLQESGVIEPTLGGKPPKNAPAALKNALENNRGSIDNVASTLTDLMHSAENENVRLSAAKMIGTALGALNEMNDAPPPIININILSSDALSQPIINILMPRGVNDARPVEAIN